MIKELLGESYIGYRNFVGTGALVTLFVAAITLILLVMRNNRRITPLVVSVYGSIAAAAAYVLERITGSDGSKGKKYLTAIFAALLFVLAVTSAGTNVFSQGQSVRAENDMHIPSYITEAADVILSEDAGARVLAMPGWGEWFAAYTSAPEMICPQETDADSPDEDMRTLYAQLGVVHPDMRKVAAIAHRMDIKYVALSDGIWPDVPITDLGYELIMETDGCRLYREVSAP